MSDATHNKADPFPQSPETSRLLQMPFSARAGAAGFKRREREAFIRGLGAGKDETATSGFFFTATVWGIRLFLRLLGVYERGLRNADDLRLVRRDIAVPDLPHALDGFTILHISDFHFPRRFPEFSEALGALLDGLDVDLCALTGDFRYGYFGPADHVARHLQTALKGVKSRHGAYAILGNHDRFVTGQLLEESGFPVLFNEGVVVEARGCALWLCGIDEPHFYKCDDLENALREKPDGAVSILLAHSPERIMQAAERGVSLYLAGHTHGGQIRFPVIGALVSNSRCRRDQIWGVWRYKNMAGHTTAGIGATDVPVRFNCPPEAVVLTLRREVSAP
jgi:uncharacterized protein